MEKHLRNIPVKFPNFVYESTEAQKSSVTHERSHSDQGIFLGFFHLSPSLTCHPFSILLSAQEIDLYVWKLLSCVQLFATPWTIQSMEFSRPKY